MEQFKMISTYEFENIELNPFIKVMEGNNISDKILEEYFYDSNGDRIKINRYSYEGGTNETIYTPYREWMQIRNSSGTFNFYYIYQGDTLVARKNSDGTTHYYHPDHLGSTTLITDENGNVVENEFYSPFGESLSVNNAEENKLYTGQFKDTTGQYYYGARYYMPKWGIFVMVDTSIPNPYAPQYLNRYTYVLNNPYAYIDPSGQRIETRQEQYNGEEITAIYEDSLYIGKVTEARLEKYEVPIIFNGQDTGQTFKGELYDYKVQRGSKFLTPGGEYINEFGQPEEWLSDITIKNQKKLLREENLEWGEAGIYDIASVFSLGASNFAKGARVISNIGTAKSGLNILTGNAPIWSILPGTATINNWVNNNQGYQPYTKIESYGGGYTIGEIGGSKITVTRTGSIVTRWGKSGRGTGGAYCKKGCG